MKPLAECRLYAFVDTAYLHGRDPAELARQLCEGGADLIQVRAKHETFEQARALAKAVRAVTAQHNVGLVVNDHLEIAREVGADICHLGQEDFFDAGWKHVSELLRPGETLQIGLSTHAPEQAERAIAAGAHYVAIGPVFPTGTKPTARPVTLEYVRWAKEQVRIPWFSIGGITLENLDSVMDAGARGICVVSAILNADDVRGACQQFVRRITSRREQA